MTDPAVHVPVSFPVVRPVRKGWLAMSMACALLGSLVLAPVASYLVWGYAFQEMSAHSACAARHDLTKTTPGAGDDSSVPEAATPSNPASQDATPPTATHRIDNPSVFIAMAAGIALFYLSFFLFIPFFITDCVVFYRAWQSLQPLRQLMPGQCGELLSPGMALGLLFIPYFNLYWCFPALLRLESFGRMMAQVRGEAYEGPSRTWMLVTLLFSIFLMPLLYVVVCFVWIALIVIYPGSFTAFLLPMIIALSLLFSSWLILCIITSWRINRMTARFGAVPVTPLPRITP